jgi:hypothetical protein
MPKVVRGGGGGGGGGGLVGGGPSLDPASDGGGGDLVASSLVLRPATKPTRTCVDWTSCSFRRCVPKNGVADGDVDDCRRPKVVFGYEYCDPAGDCDAEW